MKYTPGPWTKTNFAGDIYITSSTAETVADIRMRTEKIETEANARLIASAPELLEALKTLYEACVLADNKEELSEDVDGSYLDKARIVIKKAEGAGS